MLIITRRPSEAFTLEDEDGKIDTMTITILEVIGAQVKIGIKIPDNIKVLRDNANLKMKKMDHKQELTE